MAITQDVVVLNDMGASSLSSRTRTTSSGDASVRYSIEMRADPILHDFNQENLGQGPAQAIRDLLSRKMKAIGVAAADSTALRRANAAVGLAAGVPSYVARYSGGKIGLKPPRTTDPQNLFNDSGRFADGMAVRFNPTDNNFTINVPANRLDPRTFGGGEAALVRMWQRLVALVPEFKGGTEVLKHPEVVNAIGEAVADSIVTKDSRARSTRSRERWNMVERVVSDLTKIVQLGG